MATENIKEILIGSSVDDSKKLQKVIDDNGNSPAKFVFTKEHDIEVSSLVRFYNYSGVLGNGCLFRLPDNAPVKIFGVHIPMLGSKYATSVKGLSFKGFTVDGNRDNQDKGSTKVAGADHGKGYGDAIVLGNSSDPKFSNVSGCSFEDLSFKNSQGDGIRIEGGSGLTFSGIKSEYGGHDVIHLSTVSGADISKMKVELSSNNAVRTRSSTGIDIHDCDIFGDTGLAYAPAFQSESITKNRTSSKIRYFNNAVRGTWGPAWYIVATVPGNSSIEIFNNLVLDCGKMPEGNKRSGVGGVIADGWPGIEVKYNTFDGCHGYAVAAGKYVMSTTQKGSINVFRNIITDTDEPNYPGVSPGCGIANLTGSRNVVTASENCQYGNVVNHSGLTPSSVYNKDPRYVGAGDYHLKEDSPCIFEGYELGCYNGINYHPPDVSKWPAVVVSFKTEEELDAAVRMLYDTSALHDYDHVSFLNVEEVKKYV